MFKIVLIGLCGAAGTLARYSISLGLVKWCGGAFPYGTLTVNLLGCFLIGVFTQIGKNTDWLPPHWQAAMTIGFLGGLTTFSTFSYETLLLWQTEPPLRSVLNVGANLILGLAMVVAGITIARQLGS